MTWVKPDRRKVLRVLSDRGCNQNPWATGVTDLLTPFLVFLTHCSHTRMGDVKDDS